MNIMRIPPPLLRARAAIVKIATLSVVGLVLASCYLPARFDSEITLDSRGYYKLIFDGYLVDVSLYRGLRDGKIKPAEEKAKVAIIKSDLTRDPDTKQYKYYGKGIFLVKWSSSGDLLAAKTVTFLRQTELMLQLKYLEKSGTIVLSGKSISRQNQKRLANIGLGMQGEIRVKTDLPIKSSNATRQVKDPKDPRYKWLVWDIPNIFAPPPHAVFLIR